ncbi:hypothetical protein ACJ41O_006425 [Fusarium nematophilum]
MGESLLPDVYICLSLNIVLAALALGLRLHGRSIQKVPLWPEVISYGLGLHLPDLPVSVEKAQYYQALVQEVQEHTYSLAIGAAQLSLLALYWRLFNTNISARLSILILTGLTVVWLLVRILVAVFQCFPPHYFWDKSIDGKCTVDPAKFFLGSVSTHLVLDVALMILPASEGPCFHDRLCEYANLAVAQINQLAIPFAQKLAIAGMFMFGIVICIASIMMIVVSLRYDSYAEDIMWNCVPAVNWSAAEIHLSVVACCLPMLRPVIRGVGGWLGHNFASMRGHTGVSSMQLGSVDTSRHDRRVGDSTHNLACDMQNSESNVVYGHGEESDTFTSIRASAERDGYTGVAGKVVMVKHEVNLSFSNKRK